MIEARAYWTCQLVGWGIYSATVPAITAFQRPVTWADGLSALLLGASGLGLTHVYRALIRRGSWTRMNVWQWLPRVLVTCVAISLVLNVVLTASAIWVFRAFSTDEYSLAASLVLVINLSATALLWSLIYFAVHYVEQLRWAERDRFELELAVKDAQLSALRAQLNPHFLFNALNSIRSLVSEDGDRAREAITKLSIVLRAALRSGDEALLPRSRELDLVRSYLDLEAIRLEDRLCVQLDLDAAADDAMVPPMLLQTLVENGIKHGIAKLRDGGTLALTTRRKGDRVQVRIVNTASADRGDDSSGIGLENSASRLRLTLGPSASLRLYRSGTEEVTAELDLPTGGAA